MADFRKVVEWIYSRDWDLGLTNLLKTLVGYSAVSVGGLLPISIAVVLLGIFQEFGLQDNLFLQLLLISIVIITISHFLGLFFGLAISNLQWIRSATKLLWEEHTPPYPEQREQSTRDIRMGDRESFVVAEKKFRKFYALGIIAFCLEIIVLGLGVITLVLLGVNEISGVVDSIARILGTAQDGVRRFPILGDALEIITFLLQFNAVLVSLALLPSIFFTFATHNGVYVFGEFFILRQNRITLNSRRYSMYFHWSVISSVMFFLMLLLFVASVLSTLYFVIFTIVLLSCVLYLVYYVISRNR